MEGTSETPHYQIRGCSKHRHRKEWPCCEGLGLRGSFKVPFLSARDLLVRGVQILVLPQGGFTFFDQA